MVYNFSVQDFKEYQDAFNVISKQINRTSLDDLKNQYKIILEEIKETGEALENNDPVEVLDGCVDSLFTVLGLLQKLEGLKFDVSGALLRVACDNIDKFPKSEKVAIETQNFYKSKQISTEIVYNEQYDRFVILDENDKVKKPLNFKHTNLSEFVPDKILKNGFN